MLGDQRHFPKNHQRRETNHAKGSTGRAHHDAPDELFAKGRLVEKAFPLKCTNTACALADGLLPASALLTLRKLYATST